MLILSHADTFGVYLDEFAERVHQSAADAYSPSDGDVVVRKFPSGDVAGTVYRRTVLAHHHRYDFSLESTTFHHLFGLTSRSAVANSYSLNLEGFDQRLEFADRRPFLSDRGERIDGLVVDELALFVEAYHLASGAEARVDG